MVDAFYKCIIIDDERFARKLIAHYLKDYPQFKVVGQFKNTKLAKDFLMVDEHVDLIFLDIQMPNETGLDFLKNNKVSSKIIFTTAYSEFALDGYDLAVSDYLLKPISQNRFNKAVEKVHLELDQLRKSNAYRNSDDDFLTIKSGAEIHKIYTRDLIRLEADGEYIKYFTKSKDYFVLGSLKKIGEELPNNFMQVHRSHIVAVNEIISREKYNLVLKDGTEIPIGKTYRTEVLQHLKSIWN